MKKKYIDLRKGGKEASHCRPPYEGKIIPFLIVSLQKVCGQLISNGKLVTNDGFGLQNLLFPFALRHDIMRM